MANCKFWVGYLNKLYNIYLSKEKDLAIRLKSLLGFAPDKLDIYKIAFQHKSNKGLQNGQRVINNERLEYLGDAILSTVVADYLYQKYPNGNEGFLTKMRSKIVKRQTLNRVGAKIELDLILQQYNHTALSESMLGNALEALIGAVYLDQGFAKVHQFITLQILNKHLDVRRLEAIDDNFKSQLLEWGQKTNHKIEFRLLEKYKHQKKDRFKIAVFVDEKQKGLAEAYNKKHAEQKAAQRTCEQLGIIQSENSRGY